MFDSPARFLHVLPALGLIACGLPVADEPAPSGEPASAQPQALSFTQDLLFDRFSAGLGQWTESGAGNWTTGTLHSSLGYPTAGSRSPAAKSVSCTTECTLLSPAIDLRTAETATLRLLRFVDVELDAGDYLLIEVQSRGGPWSTLAYWTGGFGDTNRWHAEQYDLTSHIGADDFQVRVRTRSNAFNEYVQVDDVRVTAQFAQPGQPSSIIFSRDLNRLSAVPRTNGSQGLADARAYCQQRLIELGYYAVQQPFENEINDVAAMHGFPEPASGANVVGQGFGDTLPDEYVMISAHIDSLTSEARPQCAGANDNASGVAAMLEVARLLAQNSHRRSILFACWDAEELGSIGSWVYAEQARAENRNIRVNFNFDMIGWYDGAPGSQNIPPGFNNPAFPELADAYEDVMGPVGQGRADFIAVIGNGVVPPDSDLGTPETASDYANAFVDAAESVPNPSGLDNWRAVSMLPSKQTIELSALVGNPFMRSDHSSFWLKGYNALFITDTGELRDPTLRYHCQADDDDVAHVQVDAATRVAQATAQAAAWAADR